MSGVWGLALSFVDALGRPALQAVAVEWGAQAMPWLAALSPAGRVTADGADRSHRNNAWQSVLRTALNHHNPPRHCLQMGVALLVVELNRKNKEDAAKKEKEVQEKEQIRELHERHLHTEKVS